MKVTRALMDGISSIPGLEIVGKPDMSFSLHSRAWISTPWRTRWKDAAGG